MSPAARACSRRVATRSRADHASDAALRGNLGECVGRGRREVAVGPDNGLRLNGAGLVDAHRDRARFLELET